MSSMSISSLSWSICGLASRSIPTSYASIQREQVPVLVDGNLSLPESAAIVLYLADKYREKGLLPSDIKQRAETYCWMMFAVTELEQPLWRIIKHTLIYPEDKRSPADIMLRKKNSVPWRWCSIVILKDGNSLSATTSQSPIA